MTSLSKSLVLFLLSCIFLSSSFDIFLNIEIENRNFRIFYIFEIILIFILVNRFKVLRDSSLIFTITLWVFYNLIQSLIFYEFFPLGLMYFIWIFLSVTIIYIFRVLSKFDISLSVIRIYFLSFFFIGIFGLLQFVLSFLGFDLLVTQKWPNGIPRINGFNYEPSFFGTYLMIAWTYLYFYLFFSKECSFRLNNLKVLLFIFFTFVLILSSSRVSILFMTLIPLFHFLFSIFLSLMRGKLKKRMLITVLIVCFIFIVFLFFININEYFLMGLNLADYENAFSANERITRLLDTYSVFVNNLFFGVGFYNLPFQIQNFTDCLDWKRCQGMNIWMEILASNGIFSILFLLFLFKLFNAKPIDPSHCKILNSLKFSLFILLAMLSINQNIFRPYLWVHIGMIIFFLFNKTNENKSNFY